MRDFANKEADNKRPRLNEDDTIDPALFRARDSPILRSQPSGVSQGMALGYLGRVPTSRTEARRVGNLLRQQETLRGISAYTDPGSNDPGRSSREVTGLSTVPEPRAAPSILPSQLEVDASTSNKASERVTRSSKKRNRADAGSDSENESDLEDTKVDSRRSTKRSKHAKVPPEHNDDASDDGDRRKRKISKLNAKIAAGKGPQKGSLGPAGEVRTRKDGRMEFRDVNNPEWSKHIHN